MSTMERCRRLGKASDRLPLVMLVRISDRSKIENVVSKLVGLEMVYSPFIYKGNVVLIVDKETRTQFGSNINDLLNYVYNHLTKSIKGFKPIITTGQTLDDWSNLLKSYSQAHDIAEFLSVVNADDNAVTPVGSYEQYELALMFIHSVHHPELFSLYRRLIDPLTDEKGEHQSELIVTAFEFLQCNGNYSKAAERLHMSVAGLRYRLDKIAGLCGVDWDDMNDRVNLWVAITIHFSIQNGFRYSKKF